MTWQRKPNRKDTMVAAFNNPSASGLSRAAGIAVGVESVKAFWVDVHFEGAQQGVIATTAHVSRDARRACAARKWPLDFARAAEAQKWARSMWRHAPQGLP